MVSLRSDGVRPLPTDFLEWQVALRRWTMLESHGAPHAGVAPLVVVRQPGMAVGVSAHSIICGLLPRPDSSARRRASSASSTSAGSATARAPSTTGHRVPEAVLPAGRGFRPHCDHDALAAQAAARRRAARREPLRAGVLRVRALRPQRGGAVPLPAHRRHRRGARERAGLRQRLVAQHAVPRSGGRTRRRALPPSRNLGHALRRIRRTGGIPIRLEAGGR